MVLNSPLRTSLRRIVQSIGTPNFHPYGLHQPQRRYARSRAVTKDGKEEERARKGEGAIRRHVVSSRNDADEALRAISSPIDHAHSEQQVVAGKRSKIARNRTQVGKKGALRTAQQNLKSGEDGERHSDSFIRRYWVSPRNDADEALRSIPPTIHLNDKGDPLIGYGLSQPNPATKQTLPDESDDPILERAVEKAARPKAVSSDLAQEQQTTDHHTESAFEQAVEQGRRKVTYFAAHSSGAETRAKAFRQARRRARSKESYWRTALDFLKAKPIPSAATAVDEGDIQWLVDDITYAPVTESTPVPLRGKIRHADRTADARLRLRPEIFTPLTFSAYVSVLTQPVARSRAELNHGRAFDDTISGELQNLFCDPSNAEFIINEALERCFVFLSRESNFETLWDVFLHLQARGYSSSPSTLERVLEAAAKEPSPVRFIHVLRLLPAPGIRAWTLLHRLACRADPKQSHEVVDALREKLGADFGADVELIRDITLHRVGIDFAAHDGTTQEFFASYTARYGLEDTWLTTVLGNRIISLLLERFRNAEAWEVAQKLPSTEANTLNLFLDSLLHTRAHHNTNLTTALSYLPYFPHDTLTFSRLFALANRARAYNTARALWRAGCVSGLLSSGLRARVWASLIMAPGQGRKMWDVWMGKFVVGVGEGVDWSAFRPLHRSFDREDAVVRQERGDSQMRLSETQQFLARSVREDGVQQPDVEAEFRKIFEADVQTAGGGLRTQMKLEDLLAKAWQLDRERKGRGQDSPGRGSVVRTFDEMLRDGLMVEMEFT